MKSITRKRIILIAIAIIGALSASCSRNRGLLSELKTNQNTWTSKKVTHYRYTFFIGAMSPSDTVVIEVNDGVRTSLTSTTGTVRTPERFDRYDTMDKIFQTAADTINGSPEVELKYNPVFGYPTEIFASYHHATDSTVHYYISHFEVLK